MLKLKEHLFESRNLLGATFFAFLYFCFFGDSIFVLLPISLVVLEESC